MQALLVHPNILRLHAFWYAAADAQGHTLHLLLAPVLPGTLAELGALPIARTARHTRQLLSALAYMHARRIVHHDLKAGNVLVDSERVVVCDFGTTVQIVEGARNPRRFGCRNARARGCLS